MKNPSPAFFSKGTKMMFAAVALVTAVSVWGAGLLVPFLLAGGVSGLLITLAFTQIAIPNPSLRSNCVLLANVIVFIITQKLWGEQKPGLLEDAYWACIVQFIAGYIAVRFSSLWVLFSSRSDDDEEET